MPTNNIFFVSLFSFFIILLTIFDAHVRGDHVGTNVSQKDTSADQMPIKKQQKYNATSLEDLEALRQLSEKQFEFRNAHKVGAQNENGEHSPKHIHVELPAVDEYGDDPFEGVSEWPLREEGQ
ncbi:hypothetical protein niasHT_037298 [Heterodera trifolii]|uniref:Effector protein n=1 Tax=Heterodera trifolii TaxID=157864 RepID=A0ABD2J2H8_9BILA